MREAWFITLPFNVRSLSYFLRKDKQKESEEQIFRFSYMVCILQKRYLSKQADLNSSRRRKITYVSCKVCSSLKKKILRVPLHRYYRNRRSPAICSARTDLRRQRCMRCQIHANTRGGRFLMCAASAPSDSLFGCASFPVLLTSRNRHCIFQLIEINRSLIPVQN